MSMAGINSSMINLVFDLVPSEKRMDALALSDAAAGFPDWIEDFLAYYKEHSCPLDFFSWHLYSARPEVYPEKAEKIRRMLDSHGFGSAESILNE